MAEKFKQQETTRKIEGKNLELISKDYFDVLWKKLDTMKKNSGQPKYQPQVEINLKEKGLLNFSISKVDDGKKIIYINKRYSADSKSNDIFGGEHLNAVLSFDKKTNSFRYSSEHYKLPQMGHHEPAKTIISNEKALEIMHTLNSEIEAAESGKEIKKNTKAYLTDLKKEIKK